MQLPPYRVGVADGHPLTIIAGPCVAESRELCLRIGEAVHARCHELGLQYVFKASFDKANRSSIASPRGPGIEAGLDTIRTVGRELGVPTTTDIHDAAQAPLAAASVDLLQIPAFLCRQTDLLAAAAATGKPMNVKKGQFMSPAEMANVVAKVKEARPGVQGGEADLADPRPHAHRARHVLRLPPPRQ